MTRHHLPLMVLGRFYRIDQEPAVGGGVESFLEPRDAVSQTYEKRFPYYASSIMKVPKSGHRHHQHSALADSYKILNISRVDESALEFEIVLDRGLYSCYKRRHEIIWQKHNATSNDSVNVIMGRGRLGRVGVWARCDLTLRLYLSLLVQWRLDIQPWAHISLTWASGDTSLGTWETLDSAEPSCAISFSLVSLLTSTFTSASTTFSRNCKNEKKKQVSLYLRCKAWQNRKHLQPMR